MVNRDPKKKAPDPPQWYPAPDERVLMAKKRQLEKSQPKPGTFAYMVKQAKEARQRKAG